MKHRCRPTGAASKDGVDAVARRDFSPHEDPPEGQPRNPVPGLAMEAATSAAMAHVVGPFDRHAAQAWMDRAVDRAQAAGELTPIGSRPPELLRLHHWLTRAFARGQSVRQHQERTRTLMASDSTTVWASQWRMGDGGGPATRTSVKQFPDGYRPALEVSTYTGVSLNLGPRRSVLSEARELAKQMESNFHYSLEALGAEHLQAAINAAVLGTANEG